MGKRVSCVVSPFAVFSLERVWSLVILLSSNPIASHKVQCIKPSLVLYLLQSPRTDPIALLSTHQWPAISLNSYHKQFNDRQARRHPVWHLSYLFAKPAMSLRMSLKCLFVIHSQALQWVAWWTACLRNINRSIKLSKSFACWPKTLKMICASSSTTRSTSLSSTRRAFASRVRPEEHVRLYWILIINFSTKLFITHPKWFLTEGFEYVQKYCFPL